MNKNKEHPYIHTYTYIYIYIHTRLQNYVNYLFKVFSLSRSHFGIIKPEYKTDIVMRMKILQQEICELEIYLFIQQSRFKRRIIIPM
jgi:hypothetical protein